MTAEYGMYVNGKWRTTGPQVRVLDKYSGELVAQVVNARPDDVEAAVAGAHRAVSSPLPPADRHDVLMKASGLLLERREQLEHDYVAETGFTARDASGEVDRAAQVLRLSAHESLRLAGEQIPIDATRGSENRLAFTMRVPVGVVAAIAPFNAPFVTVAHKVGPAIAAGNAVVLKPAEATPISAVHLTEALEAAGLPPGFLQLLPGAGKTVGAALVSDPRVRFVTFTGSTRVGREIRARSGLARTHLELGANSASIVAADADLDLVTEITLRSGYRKAGQVCTSIQRLLVHAQVAEELAERLVPRVEQLIAGDPRDAATHVGPMIHEREALRAASWIEESCDSRTRVTGGTRRGAVLAPALVSAPKPNSRLLQEEVFAPVVTVVPVDSFDEAIAQVNAGQYGLQTGVFTQDIDRAMAAVRRLQVGGVMINDSSSYHADAMPYGGVKESGHGVEAPRYAAMDMTDPRIVVMNLRPPQ